MNWDGAILTDSGGFQVFGAKEEIKAYFVVDRWVRGALTKRPSTKPSGPSFQSPLDNDVKEAMGA